MSLKIRLARGGTKKRPFFRIVIADSRMPRDGRFVERVGTYNPMLPKKHPSRVELKTERIKHWIAVGAKPSDRVARFLGKFDVIPMPTIRDQTKKNKPKAKALERLKEAEEKARTSNEIVSSVEVKSNGENTEGTLVVEEPVSVNEKNTAVQPAEKNADTDS